MVLLNASKLKKMFSDEVLFENVSFNVDEKDKIGFIGTNGAGKSTLFKIINDMSEYDEGEVYKNKLAKIGYLDQYTCTESNNTIMGEMLLAFKDVIDIENQLEEIRYDIDNGCGDIEGLVKRQTALQEEFEKLDGYQYKSRIRSALLGLGFKEEEFDKRIDTLSGGQKTRISLGRLLMSDNNLLLLDEPTNHLDIDSVEWLENFLQGYKGAFIVISHDRYFLDKVTNRTFELDNGRLRTYNGGYSEYLTQREIERKTEERQYANTMNEINRLESIVEQQRRWNREKNIKTAESKQKVIDKLEKTLVKPTASTDELEFSFKALEGGGNDVLITEGLGMSFGDKEIYKNCDLHVVKGEKVFLLGPNGCGKTTFIKSIIGQYTPTQGCVKIGANIKMGYYDQIQESLNRDKDIFTEIHDQFPALTQTQVRNALAVFLFKGDDVFKVIGSLSGGERARVQLTKLMLNPVNFLIMDEPTNHLDVDSREALENALSDYEGTMLVVSHDRYFINKLADRIVYMDGDGLESYQGTYEEFVQRRNTDKVESVAVADKPKNMDYQEQKRIQAEKRKTINRFNKVEELISSIEKKIDELNNEMLKPEYSADFTELAKLSSQVEKNNEELLRLMDEWEALQTEIEEKGYDV